MQPPVAHDALFERIAVWFATAIRIVLNLLALLTLIALVAGVIKSGVDLFHNFGKPLSTILEEILLDAVFILALVEIVMTILAYLRDDHVHVCYIVDTVLIIMLNEIVSMWLTHPSLQNAISLSVIVGILAAVRIGLTILKPKQASDES